MDEVSRRDFSLLDNLDHIDDYLTYHEQLSFVATGPSIDQSRLIDGILLPIHNAKKLLPSFTSKSQCNLVFLNLSPSDTSFSIVDRHQQFFSYETTVYRQFIRQHLVDVHLLVSSALIDPIFVFELHQANINVIDTVDEQTFDFLLQVYRCLPCDRLFLADDQTIDKRSTVLIDRYVIVNEQAYIYLSSNGQLALIENLLLSILLDLLRCSPDPSLLRSNTDVGLDNGEDPDQSGSSDQIHRAKTPRKIVVTDGHRTELSSLRC